MVFFKTAMPTNDVMPIKCRHCHLDEEKDGDWMEAIMKMQPEKVQDILDNSSRSRRELLLNSHFVYNDGHVARYKKGDCFTLRLPLALAMTRDAREIVEILLREGADPCQQDCDGNNVLHSLVMYNFYNPGLEETIVQNFHHFVKLIPEEERRSLLMTDNDFGLRPTEFATQHGCFRLMLAMLQVPGVHLAREESYGSTTYQWFEVTEYETSLDRFTKSPLLLMAFSDARVLATSGFEEMQANGLFLAWLQAKFAMNLPFIIMLFLFRMCYISLYFIMDMDTSFYQDFVPGNSTHHCRPDFAPVFSPTLKTTGLCVLLVCSVCVMVLELSELIRFNGKFYWPLNETVTGKKKWQAQITFYKVANLIFSIFVFLYAVFTLMSRNFHVFYSTTRVICPIVAVWNILYFVQLLPSIGTFIITIQAILKDLLHFIIILVIFMVPFMHSFQSVVNTNTNVGCIESFTTPLRISYTLFITILNMEDYTTYDVRDKEALLATHVAYTFVVSIMMINFFIALLSESVSKYSASALIVLYFQRAAVTMLMERRYRWLFKSFYVYMQKKQFHYEDGRLFLIRVKSC